MIPYPKDEGEWKIGKEIKLVAAHVLHRQRQGQFVENFPE
jgi:hypothetical protein